ncbi:MAG TPA: YCF48-related protein [Planctomycetaceae bacterium]|nr:YCF48-related protein [Planctomycetaceae bacterium]
MKRHHARGWIAALFLSVAAATVWGADTAAPQQDDATLHDVQWLGSKLAFAVGEHGTCWKSADGGQTWTFVPAPTHASLRSVSFLTDQIGYIAGVEYQPYVGLERGIIFATENGGVTWQRCNDQRLSGVKSLRFFTPDDGLAVCTPTPSAPTGIFRTSDAGQTWSPIRGPASHSWTAAFLASPELGVLVGETGQIALLADTQILPSKLPPLGSRRVHGLMLQSADSGWLVGDGGLVMHTATGGVVWQSPPGRLPDELRHIFDFESIDARGSGVWIVGSPGSVVWHSPDSGKSWSPQTTPDAAPLRKVRFVSPQVGLAVGDLGRILRTEDGGQTWKSIRGGGRRLALLSVAPQIARVPTDLFAKVAADQGFRAASWVPTRSTAESHISAEALQASLISVGAVGGAIDWRLPVDLPGLDHHGERLMSHWQQQTEGRAPAVFLSAVVKQIRMWRPDVVVVDEAPEGNSLAQYVQQALLAGVREAADPTRHLDQVELASLGAWKTPRVFVRLPDGSRGAVSIDPQEFLPYRQSSLQLAGAPARSLLGQPAAGALSFRPLSPGGADDAAPRDFFQGLNVSPGSATRRSLPVLNDADIALHQQRIQKQRHFSALAATAMNDKAQTAQLAAQLPVVLQQARPEEAVALMSDLAQSHVQRAQFEAAEATYLELVRRFPEDPAALSAMRWLLQYWTSAEVAWQRQRHTGTTIATRDTNIDAVQNRVQQAGGAGAFLTAPQNPQDILQTRASGTVNRGIANRKGTNPQAPPDALTEWRKRAANLAQQVEDQSPALFERPEIQFPLAALRRARGSAGQADGVYRRFSTVSPDEATKALAERELWLGQMTAEVPRNLLVCKRTPMRPHLDGLLSDPCWQHATEVTLGDPAQQDAQTTAPALVMVAYDNEFLYVAASCPRYPGALMTMPAPSDRQHDADLEAHDRLAIALDVDRDYATWYELQADVRGETRDRCWNDNAWDPQWYVAAQADETHWRLEMAIPWSEMVAAAPMPREAWGLSLTRVIPAQAVQTWAGSTSLPPRWEHFGLVRFE